MSNISRRQDLGLGKTAAGGSGGSFASHSRAASIFSPPPKTDRELTVEHALSQHADLQHVTVSDDGVLDTRISAGENSSVSVDDILDSEAFGLREREDALAERAGYVSDMQRLAQLEAGGTFSDELDELKAAEMSALKDRIHHHETGSRHAPGNLLIASDNPTYLNSSTQDGKYEVMLEEREVDGAYGYEITQTFTLKNKLPVTQETAAEYRRELEEYYSAHYMAEVTVDPERMTISGQRTQDVSGAPTEESVERAFSETDASLVHDSMTGVSGPDPMLVAGYLETHEKLDNNKFSEVRESWMSEPHEAADILKRMDTIGTERMTPEEWGAAAWVAHGPEDLDALYYSGLSEGEKSTVRDFLYRGKVARDPLFAALTKVQQDRAFSVGFRDVSRRLRDRIEDKPLYGRPEVVPSSRP